MNHIHSLTPTQQARKFIKDIVKKTATTECIYIDKSQCSGSAISSHSIQNNRILNLLAHNGEVLMPTHEAFIKGDLARVGRGAATTFPGFCNYHDTELFKPIELHDYKPGNKQQEFLFAYRTIAKELYAKKMSTRSLVEQLHLAEKGELELDPETLRGMIEGSTFAGDTLQTEFEVLTRELEAGNFDNIITISFLILQRPTTAVSSPFLPFYSYSGKQVNDPELLVERNICILNVFPQENGTQVLFSHRVQHTRTAEFIAELAEIERMSKNKFTKVLTLIIIAYCENFVYSPLAWEKVTPKARREIVAQFFRLVYNQPGEDFLKQKDIVDIFRADR